MSESIRTKINQLLNGINDETVLTQVMEDVTFYASKKDITDDLNPEQRNDLRVALNEADNNQTISWDDFKKELNEWRKK